MFIVERKDVRGKVGEVLYIFGRRVESAMYENCYGRCWRCCRLKFERWCFFHGHSCKCSLLIIR